LRALSGRRPFVGGEYVEQELELATTPADSPPTPVLHDLRAEMSLFLSEDRSKLGAGTVSGVRRLGDEWVTTSRRVGGRIEAYENQSYQLRLRFAAPVSGWTFDESLELHIEGSRAVPGYHGRRTFERRGLRFAADETLRVTVVQADWLDVMVGDWRAMHGALWGVKLCGTPQNVMLPVNPYPRGLLLDEEPEGGDAALIDIDAYVPPSCSSHDWGVGCT